MRFAATVLACYFICIPGVYLLVRARLCASVIEAVSTGFFFGLGLVVLFYLALGRFFPIVWLDALASTLAVVALILLIKDLRRHPLPLWTALNDRMQTTIVALATLFMLLFTFAYLTVMIDDDVLVHLPNIQRITMGDVPPHFPYFPTSLLRGHVGRDVFIGTIDRFLDLRPEIGIIYTTLALCPAYVAAAYSLAWRLAKGERYPTVFCFVGLLVLVSFAIPPHEIRAGSITYVFNNNVVAFGYAFFFGWLIERIVSNFPRQWRQAPGMRYAIVLIGLGALAHTAQYFVYISNFLMFSVLIGALPFLLSLMATRDRLRVFVEAAVVVALAGIGVAVLQVLVSPLFLERVLISLNLTTPDSPMGILQQARLTFPKPLPFTITASTGDDVPFFTWHSLSAQGISFYIGLAALFVGLWTRNVGLAAASLLGWLTMLWLLLVDMGEYRAEPLRLFLLAHIGFGGSVGLMIGLGVQSAVGALAGKAAPTDNPAFQRFRELTDRWDQMVWRRFRFVADRAIRSGPIIVLAVAVVFCGWMARGSTSKFFASRPFSLKSMGRMAAILKINPEKTNFQLRVSTVDYEAFRLLGQGVKLPSERLLLKMKPDERFRIDRDDPLADMRPRYIVSAMTGAGIVGISQGHAPPAMNVAYFPYNYTASLFWQKPSVDLLAQLAPNWILLDPSEVPAARLEKIKAMPGISQVWMLERDGKQRTLLKYTAQAKPIYESLAGVRLSIDPTTAETARFEPAEAIATIEGGAAKDVMKTALLVTDEDGKTANPQDSPIVDAVRIDDHRYKLTFSMVQSGRWQVYFVDPSSGTRLNGAPLLVDVKG